jgi:hypothetical protein
MTADHRQRTALDPARVDAAIAGLNDLRDRLLRAERGEAAPDELWNALTSYRRDHGLLLRTVAWSMGELVRVQALAALYKWKEQLSAQLAARDTAATPPTASADTEPGR